MEIKSHTIYKGSTFVGTKDKNTYSVTIKGITSYNNRSLIYFELQCKTKESLIFRIKDHELEKGEFIEYLNGRNVGKIKFTYVPKYIQKLMEQNNG